MGERRRAERLAAQRLEWVIPGPDVHAGAAEVARFLHASLPAFAWGRREGGAWVLGPVPVPRRLAEDLSDSEHAGYLVRLAGLLSFLGAHGLGLSAEGVKELGLRPGSREVPWLASPPVPAWRAIPAPVVLGVTALRLAGREVVSGRSGEARRSLEEALGDGLPPRSADAVAAVLRAADGARPSDALLLDLARTGEPGERVALDLLGIAVPRELASAGGERLVAIGAVAEWVARGAVRRAPGETAFAEAGPPVSVEDGAPLRELAEALGADPRAEALHSLARGESPARQSGPPLALLARDLDRWDPRSRRAWEELPRFAGEVTRVETRSEAPAPWQSVALLVPRLGREEISGLVLLPFSSPPVLSRFWEELASEAAGDPARLLGAARQRARSFLAGPRKGASRRPTAPVDIVLRAAALLGDGFSLAEAAAVGGVSPERAAEVLEEACDDGVLLRSARGSWRFAREAERRRLESDVTRAERAAGLARLEASGAGPFRLLLARLSARAEESDVEEARLRLGEAVRSGRAEEVAALLARAPAAAPDLGEPLLAAEVHAAAGRMEDARASAARIDAPRALAEPLERREGAARLLARLGDGERALALLPRNAGPDGLLARAGLLLRLRRESEAAELLDGIEAGEGPGSVRVHLLRAELHERRQEFVAAEAELKAVAAALAGSSDDLVPVDVGFTAGYLALGVGRPREARAFFRAARDEARTPSRKADALFDLSVAAAEDGALAEAESALAEALALFSSLGEVDRYLTALGQRAALALRRSDARSAQGDLKTVLAHDRQPGRAFQLLFSIPLRQRLALADGDDADGAEAFEEARSRFGECAEHPALREILVLEGARLLAGGSAAEALARLEEAEPRPDARSGVEPLRVRLVASARRDLDRTAPAPPKLDAPDRLLFEAEERLARGLAPQPAARLALAGSLDRPEGPLEVATRLLEWHGRFPSFFASEESAPLRQLGLRAARRAGLDGAAAWFQAPLASAPRADGGDVGTPSATLVTEDAATREVFETVRRVAPHRISVLVLGESGTGKELVAREVHRASRRAGPFVAVNVAALPENLAEAELFGAVRGAFTGAERDRPGVVEASSGGTLFLDEIGDLSQQIQAKLLRVLQEREVRRLGETRTRAVDLRLVAATHRDLARLVGEGRFREDLLYRIAGITVTLPPLRERPRDLRVLLDRAFAGTPVAPEARAALLSWRWPGNVRELLSAVELARAMAGPGGRVERGHLPPALRAAPTPAAEGRGRYREAVDEAKRRVILETLAETGGNRTRAAELLGLSRQSLLYELKRLSLTD
ncbi:MAG: sigma 54-interacting transcriptional regulator [Holophagales bacterium]|nr:sigma 54-interacting transcriptional regulator [Holophagales bacterium]